MVEYKEFEKTDLRQQGNLIRKHPAEAQIVTVKNVFVLSCLGLGAFFLLKCPSQILNGGKLMSQASIAKKAELVDVVAEKMKAAASIVVVDARGLTVEQDTVLRRNLRNEGIEYKVIKNGILRRAAEKVGLENLKDIFVGPTAIAFSNEDVVAPAKIIYDFAKGADALEIKGGAIEGTASSKEDIQALATLPNREGLLSMLLSVLQAPVRNVAYAVKAVAENKEDAA